MGLPDGAENGSENKKDNRLKRLSLNFGKVYFLFLTIRTT